MRGRLATQRFIHELDRLDIVEEVFAYYPEDLFFDRDGALWSLSRTKDTLTQQIIGNYRSPTIPEPRSYRCPEPESNQRHEDFQSRCRGA